MVDRKDLDYQAMKEYQRFLPDSVNGSESAAGLKRNIEKDLSIYDKQTIFIFDKCHRSQFGKAQKNLKKKFQKYY